MKTWKDNQELCSRCSFYPHEPGKALCLHCRSVGRFRDKIRAHSLRKNTCSNCLEAMGHNSTTCPYPSGKAPIDTPFDHVDIQPPW